MPSHLDQDSSAGGVHALFLHCNPRHHTLAIGQRSPQMPTDRFIAHFMVQVNDIDTVGRAYDRALDHEVPVVRTLGRHENDRMLSFYIRSGAGFDIEFGTGALEIDDDWVVSEVMAASTWGHRPGPGS